MAKILLGTVTMRPALIALAALLALAPVSAEAASRGTARASDDIPIRTGPGTAYDTIGVLPEGSVVQLLQCTRNSGWCLFSDPDGEPAGWVRGSYLVGSGAKLEVTPHKFLTFDPLDPLNLCHDDDYEDDEDAAYDEFCW